MIKFLSRSYYYFLSGTILLLVFNIIARDRLLQRIFNSYPDQSIANADAYAMEMKWRNIFVYAGYASFAIMLLLSVVLLLYRNGERSINRYVLVTVVAMIVLLLLILQVVSKFP